jgi:enoyl-CoA hydratase/carnithine racemase
MGFPGELHQCNYEQLFDSRMVASAGPRADVATTAYSPPMDAPPFATLVVDITGDRGTLTLNRPDKLNPLSTQTLYELETAARWFDGHQELKVVVVSGAGRAMSAGADISGFSGAATWEDRDQGRRMAKAVEEMRAVTIAKMHGWCVGGGLVLAAACDLRVAAQSARFSIPEVDIGIPLAWGAIPRLVREIGPALTKELVMTCRPFDAEEARAAGFLNRVVADDLLDAAVEDLATTLTAKSKYALLATKAHVNSVAEAMASTGRNWSDADSLNAGFNDPESREKAREYLDRHRAR